MCLLITVLVLCWYFRREWTESDYQLNTSLLRSAGGGETGGQEREKNSLHNSFYLCVRHLMSLSVPSLSLPLYRQVLFSYLFQLPSPPQVSICYGSIFIELCKTDPATYPQIVSSCPVFTMCSDIITFYSFFLPLLFTTLYIVCYKHVFSCIILIHVYYNNYYTNDCW